MTTQGFRSVTCVTFRARATTLVRAAPWVIHYEHSSGTLSTALPAALRTRTAAAVLGLVTGADADGEALLADQAAGAGLSRAVQRWRARLGEIPGTARLAAWQDSGLRVIVPGDAEWPTQLDDLGDMRPLLLFPNGVHH